MRHPISVRLDQGVRKDARRNSEFCALRLWGCEESCEEQGCLVAGNRGSLRCGFSFFSIISFIIIIITVSSFFHPFNFFGEGRATEQTPPSPSQTLPFYPFFTLRPTKPLLILLAPQLGLTALHPMDRRSCRMSVSRQAQSARLQRSASYTPKVRDNSFVYIS
jgi:hypothetical protein